MCVIVTGNQLTFSSNPSRPSVCIPSIVLHCRLLFPDGGGGCTYVCLLRAEKQEGQELTKAQLKRMRKKEQGKQGPEANDAHANTDAPAPAEAQPQEQEKEKDKGKDDKKKKKGVCVCVCVCVRACVCAMIRC